MAKKTFGEYFHEAKSHMESARKGMEALSLGEVEKRILAKFDTNWTAASEMFDHRPGNPDQFLHSLMQAAKAAQELDQIDQANWKEAGYPGDWDVPLGQLNIEFGNLWSNWSSLLGLKGFAAVIAEIMPEHPMMSGLREGLADWLLRN